ncbi:MAG: cupin domain-containing protein [Pseudomonadota bacterium]|nr:cupin domain-containing protein [Pseudomonadota bacterium]
MRTKSTATAILPPVEVQATASKPLGMPVAKFLRDYWQKQPLLIRGGFGSDFSCPIAANDFAGLACEPMALSRLIVHSPKTDRWRVETGPLAESRFNKLPKSHWTLLIQDVDKWDADVAALYRYVSFLPNWRLDDIMISYAVKGGSVGAHVDQYDVFLVQGRGHRRWQIDRRPNPPLGVRDNVALKLLSNFEPSDEWILAPGDVLYLPPGVPHHGVALDECMTISLGMRAPSSGELILDLAESLVSDMPEEQRYTDPDVMPRADPYLIDASDLQRLKIAISALRTMNDEQLGDWFGGFMSRYRNAQTPAPAARRLTESGLEQQLKRNAYLTRHPFSRMAASRCGQTYRVFFAGDRFAVSARLYHLLGQPEQLDTKAWARLAATDRGVLLQIINAGHFGVRR